MPATSNISAVDIFCGVGGLTKGLINSGIDVVAGIDADPDCEYPFTKNNSAKFFLSDVSTLREEFVADLLPKTGPTLISGCAPCQPFSKYGRGAPRRRSKWSLLQDFGRIVIAVKPDYITMENVPEVLQHSVLTPFVADLEANGYYVSFDVLFCPDYGIAQQRKRLVLLASRHGEIDLPTPTRNAENYLTVRDAIGHLPKLKAGETSASDELHRACNLSSTNLKRIQKSKPGGSWRDWPADLRSPCHRSGSGETYPSVYGRMCWDAPSPTMTTQFFGYGNGRFGHPEQDRAISIREGAILQSFPKKYEFHPRGVKISTQRLGRLIGNAVPVRLGAAIGRAIIRHERGRNDG